MKFELFLFFVVLATLFVESQARAARVKRQNLCPTNKTNQEIAAEIEAAVKDDTSLSNGLRKQLLDILKDLDNLLKSGFKSPGQESRFISIIKDLMKYVPRITPTVCQICITDWGSVCSWIDFKETGSTRPPNYTTTTKPDLCANVKIGTLEEQLCLGLYGGTTTLAPGTCDVIQIDDLIGELCETYGLTANPSPRTLGPNCTEVIFGTLQGYVCIAENGTNTTCYTNTFGILCKVEPEPTTIAPTPKPQFCDTVHIGGLEGQLCYEVNDTTPLAPGECTELNLGVLVGEVCQGNGTTIWPSMGPNCDMVTFDTLQGYVCLMEPTTQGPVTTFVLQTTTTKPSLCDMVHIDAIERQLCLEMFNNSATPAPGTCDVIQVDNFVGELCETLGATPNLGASPTTLGPNCDEISFGTLQGYVCVVENGTNTTCQPNIWGDIPPSTIKTTSTTSTTTTITSTTTITLPTTPTPTTTTPKPTTTTTKLTTKAPTTAKPTTTTPCSCNDPCYTMCLSPRTSLIYINPLNKTIYLTSFDTAMGNWTRTAIGMFKGYYDRMSYIIYGQEFGTTTSKLNELVRVLKGFFQATSSMQAMVEAVKQTGWCTVKEFINCHDKWLIP